MSRKGVMDFIKRISGTPRQIYIPFYLLDICGNSYEAAVLMNQILFWSDDPHRRKDGWYAAPYEKITKELRLSKFRVMGAMKILSALGVETKSMISPRHKYARVVHYRVNEEIFKKVIEDYLDTEDSTLWSEETSFDNEGSSEETSFDEVDYIDAVSSKKKREKEDNRKEIVAPLAQPADLPPQGDPDDLLMDADEIESLPSTKKQKSTCAENSEKRLSKATTPPIPNSAPPLSPTPTVSAAEALAAAMGLTPVGDDWARFGRVASKLLKSKAIVIEEFKQYVEYWTHRAESEHWRLTVDSLIGGVRMSEYVQWRSEHPMRDIRNQKPLPKEPDPSEYVSRDVARAFLANILPDLSAAYGIDAAESFEL